MYFLICFALYSFSNVFGYSARKSINLSPRACTIYCVSSVHLRTKLLCCALSTQMVLHWMSPKMSNSSPITTTPANPVASFAFNDSIKVSTNSSTVIVAMHRVESSLRSKIPNTRNAFDCARDCFLH